MPPSEPSIEQLQRRIAELQLLNARSAHDLQGLLFILRSHLQMLPASAYTGRWEIFDDDIECMARLYNQMRQMLADLLRLAKLDQSPLALQALSLPKLIKTVLNRTMHPERLIVTQDTGPPLILGDESLLESVVWNLFNNATKYAADQGLTKVHLGYTQSTTELTVHLRDYGPGVPESERVRVFEPFVRLHTDQPGSGLGLSLVKRAIKLLDGRVWIESPTDGPGTVVCFTLPLADVSTSP